MGASRVLQKSSKGVSKYFEEGFLGVQGRLKAVLREIQEEASLLVQALPGD